MAEDKQIYPKRIKMENGADVVEPLHIGEDQSSPNTNLAVSINRKLYLDERTADVCFLFETNDDTVERVPAHKLILSTGSKVFKTMFYGSIPEGNEVRIPNGNSTAFKEFLQFFYLDEITMTTSENIIVAMNFVRQYGIERCMVQCVDFLKDTMTNDDVCSCYQFAVQYDLDDLKHFCEQKISANAEDVLKTEFFLNCEWEFLRLIALHSLICEEKNVLDAFVAWAKKSCEKNGIDPHAGMNLRGQLGEAVLHSIQFNRMNIEDFARHAKYEGLFRMSELLEIVQIIGCKEFKPNLFMEKPVDYKIFSWDDKRILNCSLPESRLGRTLMQREQSIYMSSNKPFLIKKLKFAKVYPANISSFERSEQSKVEMTIFKKRISDANADEKFLFGKSFYASGEGDVHVELYKPFLIHPKLSYRIRLVSLHQEFTSQRMDYGKIEIGDLHLNFSSDREGKRHQQGYNFQLLSALSFNRL